MLPILQNRIPKPHPAARRHCRRQLLLNSNHQEHHWPLAENRLYVQEATGVVSSATNISAAATEILSSLQTRQMPSLQPRLTPAVLVQQLLEELFQKQGPRPDPAPHASKWDFEGMPRQGIARQI